jgi:signal transduction histidine kinase
LRWQRRIDLQPERNPGANEARLDQRETCGKLALVDAQAGAGHVGQAGPPCALAAATDKTIRAMAHISGNIDIIVKESERLTLLVNDVLDSAKLDASKVGWQFAPLAPTRILEQAIAVIAVRQDANTVIFSVRDTGIGIDPAHVITVFDKFKQVGDTLANKPQGTGLGLSICRQIIEGHGGRIWVESTLGQGSIFRFTIPADVTGTHPVE